MNNPNENAPTYEEFKELIAERLAPMIEAVRRTDSNNPTAREYVFSEEGDGVVREHFDMDLEKFNKGQITREIFLGDCVSSAVMCLSLMYGS